jgi:hypothetical protein
MMYSVFAHYKGALTMSKKTGPRAIAIPEDLVIQIAAVRGDTDLDSFVCLAIRSYLAILRQRKQYRQLTREYAGSERQYDELSADQADEVWMRLEEEATKCAAKDKQVKGFSEN